MQLEGELHGGAVDGENGVARFEAGAICGAVGDDLANGDAFLRIVALGLEADAERALPLLRKGTRRDADDAGGERVFVHTHGGDERADGHIAGGEFRGRQAGGVELDECEVVGVEFVHHFGADDAAIQKLGFEALVLDLAGFGEGVAVGADHRGEGDLFAVAGEADGGFACRLHERTPLSQDRAVLLAIPRGGVRLAVPAALDAAKEVFDAAAVVAGLRLLPVALAHLFEQVIKRASALALAFAHVFAQEVFHLLLHLVAHLLERIGVLVAGFYFLTVTEKARAGAVAAEFKAELLRLPGLGLLRVQGEKGATGGERGGESGQDITGFHGS